MTYGLLIFFFIGLLFTIAGWKVTFTKDGLEWMYKNGIWKRDEALFSEKGGRRFDRMRASGIFMLGIVWSIGSLILLWLEVFK